MNLPRPGAPHCDNLIATLLTNGNTSASLRPNGLDRIAQYQGFNPGEFRARFAQIETAWSLTPKNTYEVEGK